MEQATFLARPRQTNCQQEPAYPGHETVVCALRAPELLCHLATPQCPIEGPHRWDECGEV